MLTAAIPLLHVESSLKALAFYRDALGFAVQSIYRPEAGRADPAYLVMKRDGAILHVSSFPGDGAAGGVVTIAVTDIGQVHEDLVRRGVDAGPGIMNQSWGNREVYVRDPAGNTLRFQSD